MEFKWQKGFGQIKKVLSSVRPQNPLPPLTYANEPAKADGLTVAQTSEYAAARIGNPQDIEHRFAAALVIASPLPTVHWQWHFRGIADICSQIARIMPEKRSAGAISLLDKLEGGMTRVIFSRTTREPRKYSAPDGA